MEDNQADPFPLQEKGTMSMITPCANHYAIIHRCTFDQALSTAKACPKCRYSPRTVD